MALRDFFRLLLVHGGAVVVLHVLLMPCGFSLASSHIAKTWVRLTADFKLVVGVSMNLAFCVSPVTDW